MCIFLNLRVMKDSNSINLLSQESLLVARDQTISNKTAKRFPLELFERQSLIVV